MRQSPPLQLVGTNALAARLGVTPAGVRWLETQGQIKPGIRVEGGHRVWLAEDAERIAAERSKARHEETAVVGR